VHFRIETEALRDALARLGPDAQERAYARGFAIPPGLRVARAETLTEAVLAGRV
jgi:hypothetical protein